MRSDSRDAACHLRGRLENDVRARRCNLSVDTDLLRFPGVSESDDVLAAFTPKAPKAPINLPQCHRIVTSLAKRNVT